MPGQIEEKSEISARDAIFWQELSHFLNGDMLWSEIFSLDGSVKIDVSPESMKEAFTVRMGKQRFRDYLLGDFSQKGKNDYQLTLLENYMLQVRRLNDKGVKVLPLISNQSADGSFKTAYRDKESFVAKVDGLAQKICRDAGSPQLSLRCWRLGRAFLELDVGGDYACETSVKKSALNLIMKLPSDERLANLQSIFDVTDSVMSVEMFMRESTNGMSQPSINKEDSSLHEAYHHYLTMKKEVMKKTPFVIKSSFQSVMQMMIPETKKMATELTALSVFDAVCNKKAVDHLFVAAVKDKYRPELLSEFFSLLLDLRGSGAPRHALFESGSPMAHLAYRLMESPQYEKAMMQYLEFVRVLYEHKVFGPTQGADALIFVIQDLHEKYPRAFFDSRLACFKLFVSLYEAGHISIADAQRLTNSLVKLPSLKNNKDYALTLASLLLYFQLPKEYPLSTNDCLEYADALFEEIQKQVPAEKAKLIQMMVNPKTPLGEYFQRAEAIDRSILKRARQVYNVLYSDVMLEKVRQEEAVEEKSTFNVEAIAPSFKAFYQDDPENAQAFAETVMIESDALKHLEKLSLTHYENIAYFILTSVIPRNPLDLTPMLAFFELLVRISQRKGDEALSLRIAKLAKGEGFRLKGASSTRSFDQLVYQAIEHVLYYKPQRITPRETQLRMIKKNKEQIIPLLRALMSLPVGDLLKNRLYIHQEPLFDVVLSMKSPACLEEAFTNGTVLQMFFDHNVSSLSFLQKKEKAVRQLIHSQPFRQAEQYADFLDRYCPEAKAAASGEATLGGVVDRLAQSNIERTLRQQDGEFIQHSLVVDKYSNLLFALAQSGCKGMDKFRALVITLCQAIAAGGDWVLKANNLIFLKRLVDHNLISNDDFNDLILKRFMTRSQKPASYIHFLLPDLLREKGAGDTPEKMKVVFFLAQLPLPDSTKTELRHLQIRLFNYIVYERDFETLQSIAKEEKTPLNSFLTHTSSSLFVRQQPKNFKAAAEEALKPMGLHAKPEQEIAEEERRSAARVPG